MNLALKHSKSNLLRSIASQRVQSIWRPANQLISRISLFGKHAALRPMDITCNLIIIFFQKCLKGGFKLPKTAFFHKHPPIHTHTHTHTKKEKFCSKVILFFSVLKPESEPKDAYYQAVVSFWRVNTWYLKNINLCNKHFTPRNSSYNKQV